MSHGGATRYVRAELAEDDGPATFVEIDPDGTRHEADPIRVEGGRVILPPGD